MIGWIAEKCGIFMQMGQQGNTCTYLTVNDLFFIDSIFSHYVVLHSISLLLVLISSMAAAAMTDVKK